MFKLIKSYKNRPTIIINIVGKPLTKQTCIEIVNVLHHL